jgi:hypothetical protein
MAGQERSMAGIPLPVLVILALAGVFGLGAFLFVTGWLEKEGGV